MPIQLILQTSAGIKLPKPSQVSIREQLGQPTTFTISFSEDICQGDFQLLSDPAYDPLKEIEIYLKTEKKTICLVQGFVQGQQITIKHGGQGSQLQINGSDNSAKLSWETKAKAWKGEEWDTTLDRSTIETIFKNGQHWFRHFSIFKNFDKSEAKRKKASDSTEPADQKPKRKPSKPVDDKATISFDKQVVQRDHDLAFLQGLAKLCGMYVWISYGDVSVEDNTLSAIEIAHFDELPLDSTPELDLIISHENNNIDEFSFNWDAERPTVSETRQIDRRSKDKKLDRTVEAPQTKLGDVTLKQLTDGAIFGLLPGTADDNGSLRCRNRAALNEAEWFIQASCQTTYERLCKTSDKIIHAHTVVNVLGAGHRHSGKYLVSSVNHNFKGDAYNIQIQLKRNAWKETLFSSILRKAQQEYEKQINKLENIAQSII